MKDRILAAAEKRFFQYGLRKVTMDEIASDLGISKKTLYKHYSGKEEMAKEVVRKFQGAIVSLLDDMKKSIPNPLERFEKLVIEVSRRRSAMCSQFPADIKTDIPDLWEEIEDFRRRQIMGHLGDILSEGVKKGLIRSDIDTEIAASMYQAAVQTLLCPGEAGSEAFNVEKIFSTISTIFMNGVRKERENNLC